MFSSLSPSALTAVEFRDAITISDRTFVISLPDYYVFCKRDGYIDIYRNSDMLFIESVETDADYIIPSVGNTFYMIYSRTGKTFFCDVEKCDINIVQEHNDPVPYYSDVKREIRGGREYYNTDYKYLHDTTPFQYEEPEFVVDKSSFIHTYQQLPFLVSEEKHLHMYSNYYKSRTGYFKDIATVSPGCFKFEMCDHIVKTCHREKGKRRTRIWDQRFMKNAIKIFDGISHIFHDYLFFNDRYLPLFDLESQPIPITKGEIGVRKDGIDIFNTQNQTRYVWK